MQEKNKERGRKARNSGHVWERKVRTDLEANGWIVSKWQNQVENNKLIAARHQYNPFRKSYSLGSGFPDFICYKPFEVSEIVGIEAKSNGYLDKLEKEKCRWLLDNGVFDKIFIAKKKKCGRKVVVEYVEFIT